MNRKKIVKTIVISFLFLMNIAVPVALACYTPSLRLPENEVLAVHERVDAEATFNVELWDVGEGYDVADGIYLGHCIEPEADGVYSKRVLYSSYDRNMPDGVKRSPSGTPIPWAEINYLLNHKQGDWSDVQAAIEKLITGQVSVFEPTHPRLVQAMLREAHRKGAGFVPGPGQVMAVILYSDGIENTKDSDQETIIEVPVPGDDDGCKDRDRCGDSDDDDDKDKHKDGCCDSDDDDDKDNHKDRCGDSDRDGGKDKHKDGCGDSDRDGGKDKHKDGRGDSDDGRDKDKDGRGDSDDGRDKDKDGRGDSHDNDGCDDD